MSALWDVLAVVRAWTYSAGASSSGGVAGRGQVEETRGWGTGGAWLGRRGAHTGRFYWGIATVGLLCSHFSTINIMAGTGTESAQRHSAHGMHG
jgi:hypothetical protein